MRSVVTASAGVSRYPAGSGTDATAAPTTTIPNQTAAQAACRHELVIGPVAIEHLADLEQRGVGKAAVGIPLSGGDQARTQAWPHVG